MTARGQGLPERAAGFYSSAVVEAVLGPSWHPGGVQATRTLGEALDLAEGSRVLDMACGSGHSARLLAAEFHWSVVGMDIGVPTAGTRWRTAIGGPPAVIRGRMERMPLRDGSFEGAYSECSLCLSASTAEVAREARRVLTPGGRLAIADMTVESEAALPSDLAKCLSEVLCLASAGPRKALETALSGAGFDPMSSRDMTGDLLGLLTSLREKADLAVRFVERGEVVIGGMDLHDAPALLEACEAQANDGNLGYWLVVGETPGHGSQSV